MNLKKDRQTTLNHMITPILMPQISDPRITIQTFNSPASPILPGVIPTPQVNFSLKLPENKNKDANKIVVDETIIRENNPLSQKETMKKQIENAFLEALEKDFNSPILDDAVGHKHTKPLSIAVMSSVTQRKLDQLEETGKMQSIVNSLTELQHNYLKYQSELNSKMTNLDFGLKKWTTISLNFFA